MKKPAHFILPLLLMASSFYLTQCDPAPTPQCDVTSMQLNYYNEAISGGWYRLETKVYNIINGPYGPVSSNHIKDNFFLLFTYDTNGNLTQIEQFNNESPTASLFWKFTYPSGTVGSRAANVQLDINQQDYHKVYHLEYDAAYRLKKMTEDYGYTTFTYDGVGNLTLVQTYSNSYILKSRITYSNYDNGKNPLTTHRTWQMVSFNFSEHNPRKIDRLITEEGTGTPGFVVTEMATLAYSYEYNKYPYQYKVNANVYPVATYNCYTPIPPRDL